MWIILQIVLDSGGPNSLFCRLNEQLTGAAPGLFQSSAKQLWWFGEPIS